MSKTTRRQDSQSKIKVLARKFNEGRISGAEIISELDAVVDSTNDWAALMAAGALRRRVEGCED